MTTFRGTGAVFAALCLVLVQAAPRAVADPPVSAAALLLEYFELSRQAEDVNELVLAAEEDHLEAQAAADVAATELNGTLVDWNRRLNHFAQFTVDTIGQLVSGQVSTLASLSTSENTEPTVMAYVRAQKSLEDQWFRLQDVAQHSTTAEQTLTASRRQLETQRNTLNARIAQVKAAIDQLPANERNLLQAQPESAPVANVPPGAAGVALAFALAQRGRPYEWGAEGPDSYDCSGLVQTAYATAGIRLPRVAVDQSRVGTAVSRQDVRAGDLIYFRQPVTHVAMAVDHQRAVHAPTFGQTVKIAPIDAIAPITVIRRLAG